MQVDKQQFLGEVLYRLTVYEKGRVYSKKWWSRKHVTSLMNSITLMNEVIQSLSEENITNHDYKLVEKIVENRELFLFDEKLLNRWRDNHYALSSIDNLSIFQDVNQLMNNIVVELKDTIKIQNKENKLKIWYLLQGFHNLPKVYFNPEKESILGNHHPPILCDVALECAQRYLRKRWFNNLYSYIIKWYNNGSNHKVVKERWNK